MAKTTKKKGAKKKRVSAKQKCLGRPPHKFTNDQINRMSQLALSGCQNNTIATIMDINIDTLLLHFKKLLTQKRCERKYILRTQQNTAAKKGNPALLIFLGKNELDQVDKREEVHGVTDDLAGLMKEIGGMGKGLTIKEGLGK